MPDDHVLLQHFIDAMVACGERTNDGRIGYDLDCLQRVVRDSPAAARDFVDLACQRAKAIPGYVQPGTVVAIAYKLAFDDDTLVQQVVAATDSVGGAADLERLSLGPHLKPRAEPPERQAARTWWRSHGGESAVCDRCETTLRRGAGYLVSDVMFEYSGGLRLNAGDMLYCRVCFEWQAAHPPGR